MGGMHCERSETINHKESYCGNCNWTGVVADTAEWVPDWDQRVDSQESGMFVCGECPECRCLAYRKVVAVTLKDISEITSSKTLDILLEQIGVGTVDNYYNETNGGKLSGILGWFYVVDDVRGVIAYFAAASDAYRFRLDLINLYLNPKEDE